MSTSSFLLVLVFSQLELGITGSTSVPLGFEDIGAEEVILVKYGKNVISSGAYIPSNMMKNRQDVQTILWRTQCNIIMNCSS